MRETHETPPNAWVVARFAEGELILPVELQLEPVARLISNLALLALLPRLVLLALLPSSALRRRSPLPGQLNALQQCSDLAGGLRRNCHFLRLIRGRHQ